MSSSNEEPPVTYYTDPQRVTINTREIPTVSSTAQNAGASGNTLYKILPFIILGVLICATAGILTAVILTKNVGSTTDASITGTTTLTPGGSSITNASTTVSTSVTTVTTTVPTTTTPTLTWNSTGDVVAGGTGVSGSAANELNMPFGLFVDSSNSLYIADWFNNRIQKWLSGASTGITVAGQASGGGGVTSSDLNQPSSIFVDSSGNIDIADSGNARIQRWANGATSGTTIAGTTGTSGSANNLLDFPYSVARDPSLGTIYIADFNNHRIMQYLSGASSGTVVAGGQGPGTNTTQLYYPVNIYLETSSNSLVIANYGANNIVRWIIGANSWTLIAGDINGTPGSTSTLLSSPIGVAVDYMSNIYVADTLNNRIQFFLAGQTNGTTIAGVTGISGSNSTLLGNPYGLTLDSQLNLYVADTTNYRVLKFSHH